MSNNHCTQQYFSNVSSRVANKPLYTSREDKPAWVNSVFSDILKESHTVLDVGCDMKQLGRLLSDRIAYKGIDICGKPDIKLDLDQTLKIPFADKEFDLVFLRRSSRAPGKLPRYI
ncbi:MAG: hypothetical protein KBB52_00545 [Candidatus Omnitrophica bacterium]|nr:hypothetical protein [Candidatus Omnitrophota bacterium]